MAGNSLSKKERLERSDDMTPVQGTVDVNIPIAVLWDAFHHANLWPRWNTCFFWAWNRDLVVGRQLIWTFEPIRRWYLYKLFSLARIVEVVPGSKVTWEVIALPGFYARHTYHMESLGEGRTRFGSWEQAMGLTFRLTRWFWIPHFVFVKNRSLDGAQYLEHIYRTHGKITEDVLPRKSYWLFLTVAILLAAALGVGVWFYRSYVRLTDTEIAPGIHALVGGGGNSLAVKSGNDLLLVDTKFPPGSGALHRWMTRHDGIPARIVNTHYHYDHTMGNPAYPDAAIYAQRRVPELMRVRDPSTWEDHESSIPKNLVDDVQVLKVGDAEVTLTYPGPAHTHGDLWVLVRQNGREIIATGDLFFNGYYPFMDPGQGGIDLPGMIQVLRRLAREHPNAVFVPGHGDLAQAADVSRFGDYLQTLVDGVAQARTNGLSEDQAAGAIDLSRWNLSILPSVHVGKLCWATASHNVRWVYRLQAGTADPNRAPCSP